MPVLIPGKSFLGSGRFGRCLRGQTDMTESDSGKMCLSLFGLCLSFFGFALLRFVEIARRLIGRSGDELAPTFHLFFRKAIGSIDGLSKGLFGITHEDLDNKTSIRLVAKTDFDRRADRKVFGDIPDRALADIGTIARC